MSPDDRARWTSVLCLLIIWALVVLYGMTL